MAGPGTLPTAAAVAAAAVTAKITAMDAQEQIKSLVRDLAPCQVKLKAVLSKLFMLTAYSGH